MRKEMKKAYRAVIGRSEDLKAEAVEKKARLSKLKSELEGKEKELELLESEHEEKIKNWALNGNGETPQPEKRIEALSRLVNDLKTAISALQVKISELEQESREIKLEAMNEWPFQIKTGRINEIVEEVGNRVEDLLHEAYAVHSISVGAFHSKSQNWNEFVGRCFERPAISSDEWTERLQRVRAELFG